ncbi:MAG: hypothetical protein ACLQNE_38640 [Thermoguttaceae bacterium]
MGNFPPASQEKNRPAPGTKVDFTIAPDDATYLQEVAWKVYQREIKNIKPAEQELRASLHITAGSPGDHVDRAPVLPERLAN